MHHPTHRIAHTTAFVTPVVETRIKEVISSMLNPSPSCKSKQVASKLIFHSSNMGSINQ